MSNKEKHPVQELALAVAKFVDEHNGGETVALNVGDRSGFTDYFVIATVTSSGHMKGLVGQLYDLLEEYDLRPHRGRHRPVEEGWVLLDCGPIVVHLMTAEMREFYDLERLWFGSDIVFRAEGAAEKE
ncbi:MAG TPA: ribosome silencing factor [Spirochaetia bacterium]|nr:ribosome silencing factor [Spirochaetia bacterium]